MREKTIEAAERRKARDRIKQKGYRDAKNAAKRAAMKVLPVNKYLGPKLFRGPPMPDKSKAELRAMIAEAFSNTARM